VAFGLVGCAVAGMVIRKIPIMRTNLGGLLIINLVLTFAIPASRSAATSAAWSRASCAAWC
jgi:hypothetical protein